MGAPSTSGQNIAQGMALVATCVKSLRSFEKILKALVVNKTRALEELNSDWTASQEVADRLMKNYGLPFRIGHHFASAMVSYAKKNGLTPLDFPYTEACRLYAETTMKEGGDTTFPMDEAEFRSSLNPVAIVENRKTLGGPQSAEVERMLKGQVEALEAHKAWTADQLSNIEESLARLDSDFSMFL